MSPQTLLHLLYFLPALIVYGIWTWRAWKCKPKGWFLLNEWSHGTWDSWFIAHGLFALALSVICLTEGIKYFTN